MSKEKMYVNHERVEYRFTTEVESGVPELVLCWLLTHYASVIETQRVIPRSWAEAGWPD